MEDRRPLTAISSKEDYGSGARADTDVESASSGSYSAAASPYWTGPAQSAAKRGKSEGFSPLVAFCFTINYILGAGFLTIPWAFVQSGLLLSSVMLLVSAVGSDIAKNYMLETMSRAEAMLDNKMHWKKHEAKRGGADDSTPRVLLRPPAKIERERLLQQQSPKPTHTQKQSGDKEVPVHKSLSFQSLQDAFSKAKLTPGQENRHRHVVVLKPKKYIVKDRKFEANALCRVFLGKRGLHAFTFVLSLYMLGTLWAYTSVFSSAVARAFPVFSSGTSDDPHQLIGVFGLIVTTTASAESLNYLCFAILFGCIVVPLSCLELDEQVPLQVFLTGCRFLMFFLMIGTSGMCAEDVSAIRAHSGAMTDESSDTSNEVDSVRWAGIANTLPILIFANIFHHSIPGLAHPAADKRSIGHVFTATNVFTVTAYLVLGLSLGSAFGKGIEQSSNLNWSYFHANTGHLDDQGNVVGAAWWTRAVSMYIMLFPAIDVVSAYPLNAITLGNNLLGAVYGKRIHEVEGQRWLRTGFRCLASIPPILFGILVRNLGVITDYTGTTGFLIGISFPAILYVSSRRIAERRQFAADTFYSGYGSSISIARFQFWIGIFMVVFVFATLTLREISENKE
ncbi:unnamed protein product [Pseudo-nitzschia multistriata]|uniref:Amino acid transporter transmembrane domain-containing protein n=1 Tax=Pseudo-nitzschia multistriata TaxID=183589 RepID=A0A448ZGQ9_9STRA|nr:unnamed protein product [Pseudo-nitzschia multistriata]